MSLEGKNDRIVTLTKCTSCATARLLFASGFVPAVPVSYTHLYERGFDSNGVERVYEYARFVAPHTVEVAGELYTAPHILIATGGHSLYPNIPGSEYGITSVSYTHLSFL